jgi:hypothetical protein
MGEKKLRQEFSENVSSFGEGTTGDILERIP